MQITDLLQPEHIRLHSAAADLPAAVHTLCGLLAQDDAVQDAALLEQDVLARLAQGCICMGNGLAVPHAKTAAVHKAALAAITLDKPINCPTPDGEPVDLLFLIAAPEGENDLHIRVLAALAGCLAVMMNCACPAPHGGVFLLAVMGNPLGFILANAAGALLTAVILGVTKKDAPQEE